MLETATCAACGAVGLVPHLAVAGEIGADGLIPTTDRFGTALADIRPLSALPGGIVWLANRLWAPDFRDRMAVIARAAA